MKSKYRVTIKFWDEKDRVSYLRLPANTPICVITGHGTINEEVVDEMYKVIKAKGVPDEALPFFQMPTAPTTKQ